MKELDDYINAVQRLKDASGIVFDSAVEDLRSCPWNGDKSAPSWSWEAPEEEWTFEGEVTPWKNSVLETGDLVFLRIFSDIGLSHYWIVFDKRNALDLEAAYAPTR